MARLFRAREEKPLAQSINGDLSSVSGLESPFGELGCDLSDSDLKETAYEIFAASCRTGGARPLTYSSENSSPSSSSSWAAPSLQRSLTSNAASKVVKKAFVGMRSSVNKTISGSGVNGSAKEGNPSSNSSSKSKKQMTGGEIVRVQMRVSEQSEARVKRALLRISAGQLGRRIESVVLPLELLQQLKSSDFTDQLEYEAWQMRQLKVLEAGLLLHPHLPLEKSNSSSQHLREIIREASQRPFETGQNSDTMQVLRTAVTSLACRSFDGSVSEACHWADGFPLNLQLYQKLLEACFDVKKQTSLINDIDDILELLKKTWPTLGINQMLHNLCFTWVLFSRFVTTSQVDLLIATDDQLTEVAKDAKSTKDPVYCKNLSSTLSSIMGWVEKRLLAYHETFDLGNIDSMQRVVSLGVASAKILVEDISQEHRRKRKGEDVARNRVDTYIRSSIRTLFAQRMEKADSIRRSSKNQANALPVLSILAKDIGELANNEREIYSPILKKWHPLAAGVAVATLHSCYQNELKQFIVGLTELTPDAVQVLESADKLEKDLVQIAVEESVESEDGGKAVIREMPPFEIEGVISLLAKEWISTRVDVLKACVERNLQQEVWNPRVNKERIAPSAVEVLQITEETLDAFLQLPIPSLPALLSDLMTSLDKCLLHYISKTKSGCGSRKTFVPAMPALTRCTVGSKFQSSWKKEKPQVLPKKKLQAGMSNSDELFGIPQLCVRINTLQHLCSELEMMEKRVATNLRNAGSAKVENDSNGLEKIFGSSTAACLEGIQQISEATAYKVIFRNLSSVLWEGLYFGEPASARIEPMLKKLEQSLEVISEIVNDRVRTRVITDIMKASFDGLLLVLLSGGPSRAFSIQDSQIIEDDFRSLKDVFWANGDGLSNDLIDKHSSTVREVLPLFRTDTLSLIDRFRHLMLESCGPSAKYKLPLPPTSAQWDPTEPNTILRVLCHRNDDEATRFLRKTYNLPKKL